MRGFVVAPDGTPARFMLWDPTTGETMEACMQVRGGQPSFVSVPPGQINPERAQAEHVEHVRGRKGVDGANRDQGGAPATQEPATV